MSSKSGEINEKQQLFIEAYAKSFNGTQAAIAAGYSKTSARQTASTLLNRHDIQEALLRQVKVDQVLRDHTKEDVIDEVSAIAFADIYDIADWSEGEGVTFRSPQEIPIAARRAIKKITSKKTTSTNKDGDTHENVYLTLELYDKTKALEFLGRYWSLSDAGSREQRDLGPQFKRVLAAARRLAEKRKDGG